MEQLKQLGGRLLGKKCAATILGLLGLCCPSSLWAEKLDTTFVLDMVIDSTPCYYMQYNNAGQIVDHGIYKNGGTAISYDFAYSFETMKNDYYRINTGYVTNEKGDKMNILYYTCDNVTKQWFPNNIIGKRFAYHDNGMLSEAEYVDYTTAESHHSWDPETNELVNSYWTVPDHTLENNFRPDGYRLSFNYEDMTYGTNCGYPWEDVYDEEHIKYDSLGNAYYKGYLHEWCDITNTYDDRQNLISSHSVSNYVDILEEHSYDSLDRRIKTVRYDSTETGFVMKDSIVYTYGNSLKEGEPCILSTFRISQPIDGFSSDQFHYDFSSIVTYKDFIFIIPFKTSVEKSFDPETSTLSVIVKGANYAYDSTDVNTYTFALKKMESYINKVYKGNYTWTEVDFSPEKYSYDIREYNFHRFDENYSSYSDVKVNLKTDEQTFDFSFVVSEGAKVEKSYDAQTGIITITVKGGDYEVNPTNVHTYTFATKIIEANISSLQIRGNDFDAFSPDKYDYEMPQNYIWGGYNYPFYLTKEDFVFPEYNNLLYVKKSYSDSTHTLSLSLTIGGDTLSSYRFRFQPCLRGGIDLCSDSISLPVQGFAPDKFEYELPSKYKELSMKYNAEQGTLVRESFDESTNTLTLSVFHAEDSSHITNYTFHFIDECLHYPSLFVTTEGGLPADHMQMDSLKYEVIGNYDEFLCQCDVLNGKVLKSEYDDSTSIWTIVVTDTFGINNTEYHIHFRPVDGVDDFLGDQVNLYVTDKTICVDGAEEPISVYNLLGTLVGTGRGEEVRIPVPQTGIYVVKADGKAAKVVVK